MNLENAMKIEGAMEIQDLRWLAEQASKHKRIVEVGCWQGRSTRVLTDNTNGYVFAVDHWRGSAEHAEFLSHKPADFIWTEFNKNLGDRLRAGKVFPLHLPSVEAAELMSGMIFDMVFIDASHDYESVRDDIRSWRLLTEGLLCGHDYGYPPVTKAVNDSFRNVRIAGNIWYVEQL